MARWLPGLLPGRGVSEVDASFVGRPGDIAMTMSALRLYARRGAAACTGRLRIGGLLPFTVFVAEQPVHSWLGNCRPAYSTVFA